MFKDHEKATSVGGKGTYASDASDTLYRFELWATSAVKVVFLDLFLKDETRL
ncbi:hypothetical protein ACP8HI_02995 [Paenibacillus sp. FA6]|uniref:hypothetical protein n=1 Tax=Paenibacillus sp. FA6 TaxID=3413029 RepID=UPI003F656A02